MNDPRHADIAPTLSSYQRAAADFVIRQFAPIVAVLSGAGYLIGYASVWLFSLGVGISPRDLGLGNREYLMIAGLWALVLCAYALASGVLIYGTVRYATNLLISSYIGLVFITIATPWPPTIAAALLLVVILLGGLLLQHVRSSPLGPPRQIAAILLVTLWISVVGFVGWLSADWGRRLRADPARAQNGPILLTFVMPATEGLLELDSGDVCVVRLADRVYVGNDEIRVLPEAAPFRPGACF